MNITGDYSPQSGFNLNSFLGILSVLSIFLLSMAVTGKPVASLFACFFTASLPLNLFLSSCATYDMAVFLALCLFFFFLSVFMRKRAVLPAAALFLLTLDMMLLRENSALALLAVIAVLIYYKTIGFKGWIIAVLALLAIALLMSPHLSTFLLHQDSYSRHIAFYGNSFLPHIIYENIKFVLSNDFIPPAYILLSVLGFIPCRKYFSDSKWLFLYPIIVFIFLNLIKVELWQGDFPRRLFPITIPMLLLCGIGVEELIRRTGGKWTQYLLCATIVLIFMFNNKAAFTITNPVMSAQDSLISKYLPETDSSCSIYTYEPSIVMAHDRKRKVYRLDKLFDNDFLQKHKECKILLIDYMLATDPSVTATNFSREVVNKYSFDELERIRERFSFNPRHQIKDIYGIYDLEIVYLTPVNHISDSYHE
ncbi:MAG TPA: hypothetical protein PLN69_10325 [bacterium]|nr:hypothetical protein [bacterium]